MGLSLQEQLLKAGVVDKKQVKQAEHSLYSLKCGDSLGFAGEIS